MVADYKVKKITSLDGYRVFNEDLRCKEDWLFMARLLGLEEEESPSRSFIGHVSGKYPDTRFYREFYVNSKTNRFEETCGIDIIFEVRKDATAFAKELSHLLSEETV